MSANLADKTLVMIVGPSAIGKTTLMDSVTKLDKRFGYVESFTTRPQRTKEKSHYTFIDKHRALELLETGEAITAIEHPTTHDIYGTTLESYPTEYNLLDTLASSVESYQALDFQATIPISITAPVEQWRTWFLSRYPVISPEAERRLSEARESIEWSLENETHWIVNSSDTVEQSAQLLLDIVLGQTVAESVPAYPHEMLEVITKGIWQ